MNSLSLPSLPLTHSLATFSNHGHSKYFILCHLFKKEVLVNLYHDQSRRPIKLYNISIIKYLIKLDINSANTIMQNQHE